MKVLFWNIHGFGAQGRRNQLRGYLSEDRPDILCIQETIRQSFSIQELESLVAPHIFSCVWCPAVGLSGGMLTGVNSDLFDVTTTQLHRFCIVMTLRNRIVISPGSFLTFMVPLTTACPVPSSWNLVIAFSPRTCRFWWAVTLTSLGIRRIRITPIFLGRLPIDSMPCSTLRPLEKFRGLGLASPGLIAN